MAPSSSSSPPRVAAPPASVDLAAVARETKRKLDWVRLAALRNDDAQAPQWKWVENARNFSIYVKQTAGDRKGTSSLAVLAVGTVKASVNEVAALLVARTAAEFSHKMEALFDKEFKSGDHLYDVPLPEGDDFGENDEPPTQLSVRNIAFTKPGGWLSTADEWCHLDAVYRTRDSPSFERVLTALRPQDVLAHDRKPAGGTTKYFRSGVFAGYRVEQYRQSSRNEDDDSLFGTGLSATSASGGGSSSSSRGGRAIDGSKQQFLSRVHFYAEMPVATPVTLMGALAVATTKSDAPSDKLVKQRLLQMAKGCHRLSLLIRRRRLGVQTLVDRFRFLPPTNRPCFRCGKHLLVAKLCRMCGQGVCADCSDKYERETKPRGGAFRLESIRVCDPCLDRVESTDYSAVLDVSLGGPTIVPSARDSTGTGEAKAAEAELRYLLRDALVQAKSPEHKASVINVIRCVLDEEESLLEAARQSPRVPGGGGATTPLRLTPHNSVGDFTTALENLQVETVPFDDAPVRSLEDRSYQMDTRDPPSILNAPLAGNEEDRLRAVAQVDVKQLANSVELNILCDLAASEMGCTMSTISIFDRENLNCVAANFEAIHKAKLPRSNTPCAHTILENTPNLVPHPEADIRYADSEVVKKFGAKFYFAFPVVDVSDQIIGSFCVMNDSSMEVTETKYSAFKKLAETANKVVRIHTEQNRRTSSSSST